MNQLTKSVSRRPQFETLERRDVMTGVTAALSAGVLTINGTTGVDQVSLAQTNNSLTLNYKSGTETTSHATAYNAAMISSIVIDLKGGSDTVSSDSLHNGGNKAVAAPVTIKSGAAPRSLRS